MKPIILVIVMSAGFMYLLLHNTHQKVNTHKQATSPVKHRISLNNYATGKQELLVPYLLW
ncbi:hypothetical protein BH10BAC2_BH10BAC2_10560 [soil metagenome]